MRLVYLKKKELMKKSPLYQELILRGWSSLNKAREKNFLICFFNENMENYKHLATRFNLIHGQESTF
jgi:hypothetical protein